MNSIIISNTCVGQGIIKQKNLYPYNNPFIGSLIPNDNDYIKLVNNFNNYLDMNPILGNPKEDSLFAKQNKCKYYVHKDIKTPYPVIYLGDIEIHFIHENNNTECIKKFISRLNRLKEIIKNNEYKIIFTLSFSELINEHNDLKLIINNYFGDNKNNKEIKYFLGSPEYNNGNENYINIEKWYNIELNRDSSHIYDFNDQIFTINLLSKYIE